MKTFHHPDKSGRKERAEGTEDTEKSRRFFLGKRARAVHHPDKSGRKERAEGTEKSKRFY